MKGFRRSLHKILIIYSAIIMMIIIMEELASWL